MATAQVNATTLKFASLKSDIELPFYAALASFKINHDKLNDSPRRVIGVYELRPHEEPQSSCRIQLLGGALASDDVPAGHYRSEGMIRNMNTIEDYRGLDMAAILDQAGRTVWEAIIDGTIYSCPSLLVSLTMLCFADLKRYNFTYVCGFPVLHAETPWLLESSDDASPQLSSAETTALVDTVQTWRYSVDNRQYGFFIAKRVHGSKGRNASQDNDEDRAVQLGFEWAVESLGKFEQGFFNGVKKADRFICFADPSTHSQYPGWMLRNLLVLVRKRWNLTEAQILCYRDTPQFRHEARSLILRVRAGDLLPSNESASEPGNAVPKITGWERSPTGKITHRITKLGDHLDPKRLADQAVDLNLKLIKWRIAPSLDLDVIKSTKCLLLGAGTLGSYVARNLMGWGVRHITFVDNGKVSYSNPVRQPLFNFADCVEGGKHKARRAAETLREIYPGVNATGHVLSVPMAGHPIMDETRVKKEFDELEALINDHDVTFLLMDTRESRWLPTVIGKAAGKLVMNAALGFDTFLVLRHGLKKESATDTELGCYFCNDVVAPADSLSDRTLDQQCTVTRPGGAAIASALLVELMVSVLQHKKGVRAPAPFPGEKKEDDSDHPLGDVPHQIRGYLSTFSNTIVTGRSYDCCSACSDHVTNAYSKDGWGFIKRALSEKGYVEEISGLAEVQRAAEKAMADIEWDAADQDSGFDSEAEML